MKHVITIGLLSIVLMLGYITVDAMSQPTALNIQTALN